MQNTPISFEIPPFFPKRGSVLLFHGLTATPGEVEPLGIHLQKRGFDVFMPVLAGHGESIDKLRRATVDQWIADADAAYERYKERGGGKLVVGGVSFGALLALYLAATYPNDVRCVLALSAPFRLRSKQKEFILSLLSRLPDKFLDKLGTVPKEFRPAGQFLFPRDCFEAHSVGALARMFQLRSRILERIHRIRCPVLILQDPEDHHLALDSQQVLREALKTKLIETHVVPGGGHELILGHKFAKTFQQIDHFLDRMMTGP